MERKLNVYIKTYSFRPPITFPSASRDNHKTMAHSAFRTRTAVVYCARIVLHRRKAMFKAAVASWKKKKKKNWDSESSMYAFSIFLSCGSLLLKIFL